MRSSGLLALCSAALLAACGGGGGASPSFSIPTVTATPVVAGASKATFSFAIALSAGAAQSSMRRPQFVAPTTATLYLALQSTPGHGNPAFAVTASLDATNCTTSNNVKTCNVTAAVPVGNDTFSILTADANGLPLGYTNFNATVNVDGSVSMPAGATVIGGIIAKATPAYAFQSISGTAPYTGTYPAITIGAADAAGNALQMYPPADAPYGDTVGSYSVSQSAGQFTIDLSDHGRILSVSSPETQFSATGASFSSPYLIETGNGSTAAFSTTITAATPAVVYTNAEFPQLPPAGLTLPASSTQLTLTCQFVSTTPATDPCAGPITTTLPVY